MGDLLRDGRHRLGVGAVDLISACLRNNLWKANGKGGSLKENKTEEAGAAS